LRDVLTFCDTVQLYHSSCYQSAVCVKYSLQRSSSFNVLRNTPANNLQQSFSADVINEVGESGQGRALDVDEQEDDETGVKVPQGVRTYQDDGVVQDELSEIEDSAQDKSNGVDQMMSEPPRRSLIGY
jgi:hypothetical protein